MALTEGAPVFDNLYCPVCHKRMYEATICRRLQATIHMKHCHGCEFFDSLTWHCLYKDKKIPGQKSWRMIK